MEIEMPDVNSIVAVYDTQQAAEAGVRELQKAGFDLRKLSIVGKEYHSEEHIVGYYSAGDRMKYWGQMGAFWGGLCGLLSESAFFVLPGMGPILIAGPLAAGVVGSLEGAAGDSEFSILGACLSSFGIPKHNIRRYEWNLREDKILLVAHGAAKELMRAKDILRSTRPDQLNVHFEEKTIAAA
jgi:Heat induced stress protein YflT domain